MVYLYHSQVGILWFSALKPPITPISEAFFAIPGPLKSPEARLQEHANDPAVQVPTHPQSWCHHGSGTGSAAPAADPNVHGVSQ